MCTLLVRTLLHDSAFVCRVKRCFPIFVLHAIQNASSHPLCRHADVTHQSPLLVQVHRNTSLATNADPLRFVVDLLLNRPGAAYNTR